jgi:hypothetical protein
LNPSSSLVCLTKSVNFEFCHESARINDDCLTDTYAVGGCILQVLYHRLHPFVKTKNCVAINILRSYDFDRGLSSSSILNGERNDNQLRPEEILLILLEQGETDAIQAYKHELIKRGFHFISLPKKSILVMQLLKIIINKPVAPNKTKV